MIKHSQTIYLQQQTDYLSVFDHFVGLALKGLISTNYTVSNFIILFHKMSDE